MSLIGLYCLVSLAASLAAFGAFRVHAGVPRYFSVHDIGELTKAVAVSQLMTCIVLFSVTRLNGIPRSTPIVHGLLLWVGLVGARAFLNTTYGRRRSLEPLPSTSREHIVLIGLNDLSAFFLKSIEHFAQDNQRVLAILDPELRWIGRTVHGTNVLGQPGHLDAVIEEFTTHGVGTDRVLVAGAQDMLSRSDLIEIRRVCAQRDLDLEFLSRPFGLKALERASGGILPSQPLPATRRPELAIEPSLYFRVKRLIDFAASLFFIVAILPLWIAAGWLTWVFVGSPIVFWQQRLGRGGREFDLYKLRTLRPAIDRHGQRVPEPDRLTWAGRILRETRIDELPQLVNVLVGDMSLVGPRPLLLRDQPASPAGRLTVRPGVTGWAQVNGGNLLTPEEKQLLDEWYIRHASLWLDLRIIAITFRSVIRGDRRNEQSLLLARAAQMNVTPTKPSNDLARGTPEGMRPSMMPGMD